MKRKIIFVIGMMLLVSSQNVHAACVSTDKSYTACKSGYYLTKTPEFISQTTAGTCLSCPESGTSADKNATGITECCTAYFVDRGGRKSVIICMI